MELTDNDILLLEKYFNKTIDENDKQVLEERLNQDADFREAVMSYQATAAFLNTVRKREQISFLKGIDETMPPVVSQKPSLKIVWFALAASLTAFVIWYFGFREVKPKMSPIIAAYFEPFEPLGFKMGKEDNQLLKEAIFTYSEKKYYKAIPLLQSTFEETKDSMALFYKGVSLLAVGNSAEALPIFDKIQYSTSYPVFKDAAQWYLALAHTDIGHKEEAIGLLKNIPQGIYKAKAETLIQYLSKK